MIGNGLVQPTSSDEIVKARCSCVDGSAFPEWFATNCRGLHLIYSPVAPNTFFEVEEEEEAIDRSLLGACHKGAATHLLQVAALPDH